MCWSVPLAAQSNLMTASIARRMSLLVVDQCLFAQQLIVSALFAGRGCPPHANHRWFRRAEFPPIH